MAIIGLTKGTVKLHSHKKEWAFLFKQEEKRLKKILGKNAVDIQHVGSTAIPGIAAKPIIDISVGIPSMKNIPRYIKILEHAGYIYRPHFGSIKSHIVFAKGNEKKRTHYIHFVKYNGAVWKRDILFRDYLRAHAPYAKEYENLKKTLAKKFGNDRKKYTEAKTQFISHTLKRALSSNT